jgi:hypothetical protein
MELPAEAKQAAGRNMVIENSISAFFHRMQLDLTGRKRRTCIDKAGKIRLAQRLSQFGHELLDINRKKSLLTELSGRTRAYGVV